MAIWTEPCPVLITPSVGEHFWQALLMLNILGQNRAEYEERDQASPVTNQSRESGYTNPSPNQHALRREFLQALAYLCTAQRGGPDVIAIALQKTTKAIVYWLATNVFIAENTKRFLSKILGELSQTDNTKPLIIEHRIYNLAYQHAGNRIQGYIRDLQVNIGTAMAMLTWNEDGLLLDVRHYHCSR